MKNSPILVTGAAGFIGFHLCRRLLDEGAEVIGLDNINDYYDPALKKARCNILAAYEKYTFVKTDLADTPAITDLFKQYNFAHVIHLGAQAGVRYSIDNPHAYIESNIKGFLNILEGCRMSKTAHLIYASSSSVYGGNTKTPFCVADSVDHPVSLYAATKKSNELMAHTYSHLYNIPTTGLRFFTVYGEWGRPDMAYFKFTKAILAGKPIQVYNNGDMQRDFTYIDDIIEGIVRLIPKIPGVNDNFDKKAPALGASWAPYTVYNIGNNQSERLMDMIDILEKIIGKEAVKEFMPMQPGDVKSTWADVDSLQQVAGFSPDTSLKAGLEKFVHWYRDYYKV